MFTAEPYHGNKNTALCHQFWYLLKQTLSSDWFTVGQGQVHKQKAHLSYGNFTASIRR